MESFISQLLTSGFGHVAAYLAAHVLLCLLPAFYIAGAMTALIPKEAVTRYLGRTTPKVISYPAAAAAGFLLAVCSCTVIPLFAGIYKKGAGLGPAVTFLFVAPAINVLALVYTGQVLGADFALARLGLSLSFGILIGLLMAALFWRDDAQRDASTSALFAGQAQLRRPALWVLLALAGLLLVGTLPLEPLQRTYVQFTLPWPGALAAQTMLNTWLPADAARGIEGLSVQGVVLIGLLGLIGLTAWAGIERIHEGFNRWVGVSAGLVGFTLLVAALGLTPSVDGMVVALTGKFLGVLVAVAVLAWLFTTQLTADETRDTLWETWRFVKQIFPVLVVGVFAVGVLRVLIQPEWIRALAGSNTVWGNLAGVVFGVFMYFPTLVEVPIARMFLDLGMHPGPLLAYLMADPELSLQSILITATIMGRLKTWTYVGWVAVFSAVAGLVFGAWVDGSNLLWLAGLLAGGLTVSAIGWLWWQRRRPHPAPVSRS